MAQVVLTPASSARLTDSDSDNDEHFGIRAIAHHKVCEEQRTSGGGGVGVYSGALSDADEHTPFPKADTDPETGRVMAKPKRARKVDRAKAIVPRASGGDYVMVSASPTPDHSTPVVLVSAARVKDMEHSATVETKLLESVKGLEQATGGAKCWCSTCKLYFKASKVIIKDEDPGFDWEGHLHFECFLCAQQLTEAAKDKGPRKPMFSSDIVRNLKRASENAWSQRKTAMEGHSRRARAKGWKDFLEQLEIDHPGESRTQLRTRIIQAADELSRSISDAFLALSKEKREKYREVFLKWQDRYDKGKVDRE